MLFNRFWDFFTYVFRIFKLDRRPEYIKVEDDEIEFGKLSDPNAPPYTFVILR
jgi:hypothetical protein